MPYARNVREDSTNAVYVDTAGTAEGSLDRQPAGFELAADLAALDARELAT